MRMSPLRTAVMQEARVKNYVDLEEEFDPDTVQVFTPHGLSRTCSHCNAPILQLHNECRKVKFLCNVAHKRGRPAQGAVDSHIVLLWKRPGDPSRIRQRRFRVLASRSKERGMNAKHKARSTFTPALINLLN